MSGVAFVSVLTAFVMVLATGWFCFIMMRNKAVYYFRLLILVTDDEYEEKLYAKLPPYGEMVRQWWIWDLTRFCPGAHKRAIL